jgi:hypothetical protein
MSGPTDDRAGAGSSGVETAGRTGIFSTADPVVLKMPGTGQPMPIKTIACQIYVSGQAITSIHRRWKPGESSRCTRCKDCSACGDECLILTNAFAKGDDPRAFSTVAVVRQDQSAPMRIYSDRVVSELPG